MATKREQAWALFDKITEGASADGYTNPWRPDEAGKPAYDPDYATLRKLLGVPVLLSANTRTGVPALALDVWMAYELRRCGFDEDAVWPRAEAPRVLPVEVSRMVNALPSRLKSPVLDLISRGKAKAAGAASANILGKNYVKQVDVGFSSWDTGPELLISTKRMDSSFGKNAANRIEESYGDAKNLRLRHPQAGHGFFYGLRSTAFVDETATAEWLIDLLIKMGQEDDAYDAVGLLVPEWGGEGDDDSDPDPTGSGEAIYQEDTAVPEIPDDVVQAQLKQLPTINLRFDKVPAELDPARFIGLLATKVLRNSPIKFHREARARRQESLGVAKPLTRGL
jgi:hypothetical protein